MHLTRETFGSDNSHNKLGFLKRIIMQSKNELMRDYFRVRLKYTGETLNERLSFIFSILERRGRRDYFFILLFPRDVT